MQRLIVSDGKPGILGPKEGKAGILGVMGVRFMIDGTGEAFWTKPPRPARDYLRLLMMEAEVSDCFFIMLLSISMNLEYRS